ncbi:MAG: hypothetical protein AAGA12_01575 [Pseudomonadota bacterium]
MDFVKYKQSLVDFLNDEDGASVVDMVVLMSFLCAVAIAVMIYVGDGLTFLTGEIEDTVTEQDADAAW